MKETLDWVFAMEDEPSVIITKWPCVLKKYSKEDKAQFNLDKTPCVVDADKCIGCKKCLSTGCPALRYDSETKKSNIAQADCVAVRSACRSARFRPFPERGINNMSDIKSVLFVGVGGQGTILASKILTIASSDMATMSRCPKSTA